MNLAYMLRETECDQGHSFHSFITKISRPLFNIMAKNTTAYANDDIHASKKRNTNTRIYQKESVDHRKIVKLSSN